MKTKLLLSFVFLILISFSVQGLTEGGYERDSSGNGFDLTKVGSIFNMAPTKFSESAFYDNTLGGTVSNAQLTNWNYNKTYEGWLFYNNTFFSSIDQIASTTNSAGFKFRFQGSGAAELSHGLVLSWLGAGYPTNGTLFLNHTLPEFQYNDSVWHHWEINVYNTSASGKMEKRIKLFMDGVDVSHENFTNILGTSDKTQDSFSIGRLVGVAGQFYDGGLDEVRVSNVSRHIIGFTPPSAAFTVDADTLLLYHFNEGQYRVKFLQTPFLNFSTRWLQTPNTFFLNVTNSSLVSVQYKLPDLTFTNLTMVETVIAGGNWSGALNPTQVGSYNITKIFAQGIVNDVVEWNSTQFSGLTWTVTEDLAFQDTFLNLSAVLKSSPNQFWFFNRNATSGWFEVTAPNASIYNFSMTQSSGTDNFTKQMTFSTNGFYNITKLFAQNSFSSNYNTTKVAGLRWEVSNSTNIFVCNEAGADQHVAVNFTFKAELNRSDLNISKFEASFITQDLTNATGQINITVTRENVKHVAICIQPDTHDLQTNATIKYAKDGYNFRNWHYVNENLTAEQQNTTLYLLNAADATAITIQVTDSLDAAIEGAVTEVQRFYIGNNTFTIIGMIKAGNDGKDLIYLQKNEGDYRFRVLVDNVQKLLTKEAKVTSTSLILKVFETALADLIRNLGAITSSITYNNDTNIVTFTFNDPNEIIQSACVEATRHNQSGRFFFGPSCTNTSFGTSIALFSGNGSGSQLIIGAGYVIIGKLKYTVDPTAFAIGENSNVAVWGVFGAFVLFFVLLAAVMTQVHNPVAMLAMFMVALIGAFFLGIYSMPWGVLVGLIAAIVIIITQLRS